MGKKKEESWVRWKEKFVAVAIVVMSMYLSIATLSNNSHMANLGMWIVVMHMTLFLSQ